MTGRVRDKIAIIGDDITTTGSTLIAGAQALKEHGAKEVWVFVDARAALGRRAAAAERGRHRRHLVTDTVPIDPISKPEHMTVLPSPRCSPRRS